MKNNKQAGFSLVELMVVVAIIGILATIAIPNFTKFQAKAKQSSAKSELTGIYTAQKSFFTEYSTYHSNLAYIGYSPDGFPIETNGCPIFATGNRPVRYYTTGFLTDGTTTAVAATAPTGAPAIVAACGTFATALPTTGTLVNVFPSTVIMAGGTASVAVPASQAVPAGFTAASGGNVSGRTTADAWTINQDKALANTVSGI